VGNSETYGSKIASAIPMGSVLTLPATGSESNKGAVISRKTTGDKRAFMSSHVQPQFAILDPVYTYPAAARSPTAWLTPSSIPSSSTSPTRLTAKFRTVSPKAFC
jgi:hypothetical protein